MLKKNICLSFILVFVATISYGQQLLWGFEDWIEIDNEIENPLDWDVNNYSPGLDSLFNRFFKDSIHVVEGKYSMRAEKDSLINNAFFDCTSRASRYITLDDPLNEGMSFYFDVRTKSLTEWPESFVDITVGFSKDNDYLGRVEWRQYEELEAFERIELPIEFVDADAISIHLELASQNGALDDCSSNSIVWLDNLRIEESSIVKVQDYSNEHIEISPNPTIGSISFSTHKLEGAKYEILNLLGAKIQEGIIHNHKIELLHGGFNILRVEQENKMPLIFTAFKIEE